MPANVAILRISVRSTFILYRRLSHPRRSAASGAVRSRRLEADGKKARPPARGASSIDAHAGRSASSCAPGARAASVVCATPKLKKFAIPLTTPHHTVVIETVSTRRSRRNGSIQNFAGRFSRDSVVSTCSLPTQRLSPNARRRVFIGLSPRSL